MRKKIKVAIQSDYLLAKTGLGRNTREMAFWLHNTGKYEVVVYASGMSWLHPEYARFPFKVIGSLPNNPAEMEQINKSDENYRRYCGYGGYFIERFIKEEKPDVMIFSNDSWAFPYQEKPWWDKFPCVCHITLDSLPFLPDQKKQIELTKNFYVWADFAEKEAHRLGFKHVKTLTGIINQKSFYKLPNARRVEIRTKNNIPQDAFIVGFVFRNQIRKEVMPLMKGFAQFKKENPNSKAYLFFHTHWSEGWDLHRLADEIGIPKNLILTTYVCRNCWEYELREFTGQDQHCKCCGAQGSLITANVGQGVTEAQLNDIYNIFDLYCHPFNAAGLEIPIVEALSAERVVATVGYAAGTMFTDQDFVFKIDHSEGIQQQTLFYRAVPNVYSIAKIIDRVYNMPSEKREELGRVGKKWAAATFSVDVVGKQWEKVIDSFGLTNYDFNFSYEPKNDQYPFPQINDVSEFIKALYNNILKCNPDPNGYEHWLQAIKNGTSREQIYNFFIGKAREDNQAHGIGAKTLDDLVDKTSAKKRFLVVIKESFGDCLYATAVISALQEKYSDYDMYVGTDPQYFEMFEHLNIRCIPYHPTLDSEPYCTGQGDHPGVFHAYCNLAIGSQKLLNYLTHHRISLPA